MLSLSGINKKRNIFQPLNIVFQGLSFNNFRLFPILSYFFIYIIGHNCHSFVAEEQGGSGTTYFLYD